MISACKGSLENAYALVGNGEEDAAEKIAIRLATCGIRNACPYARECAARVTELRTDIRSADAGHLLVATLATYDSDALI